ncbi:MAG: S41 family peptidase [Bacteroidota bacterium]
MRPSLPFLIFFLWLTSCTEDSKNYSKRKAFDDLVSGVARYSASIETRNVNWDSLTAVYGAQVDENIGEMAFFELTAELLRHFRDPHVWLLSPSREMYTIKHLEYAQNFDEAFLDQYVRDWQTHTPTIRTGIIDGNIGYLLCTSFQGDVDTNNQGYQAAIQRLQTTDGLIIDIRPNGGGNAYNAQNLLNKITDEKRIWHITQNKVHDGFDTPYTWRMQPDPEVLYNEQVVVLAGRYTISAGERFCIGAKALPKVTLVGDTTANTQGSIMAREMLNGWTYTLTFEKVTDAQGVNYGGIGVPPDVYIAPTLADGNDVTLAYAISVLR